MKNILIFDLETDCFKAIEYEEDGTNSVFVKFVNVRNVGNNACVEFHKTEKHTGIINVNVSNQTFIVEIPTEYMNDGSVLHFRYMDSTRKSRFFHLLGNVAEYIDIQVTSVTESVFEIDKNAEKKPEPEPDPPEPEPPAPETTTTIECVAKLEPPNYNLINVLEMKIQTCVKEE